MDASARKTVVGILLLGTFAGGCASAPRYEGLSPDQLFALGAREFRERDWGDAAEVFQRLTFSFPAHPRIVEARMYLARAHYNDGEYATAAFEFSRILERQPGHELAPEASLGICQSRAALSPHVQRDQPPTVRALVACEATLADFAGHPVEKEARILRDRMEEKLAHKTFIGGEFYFRKRLYHPGILYFDDLLEEFPHTDTAAKALLRLFQSYSALEWHREAEAVRERLLREFPDSEAARRIRGGPWPLESSRAR